jgi:exodeoxyribonuclease VII large subunit
LQLRARVQEIASVADRYDLLLVTRGGGSAQDLACFNDESLARQLAAFPIPVVAAVGHEVDFSLIDFVADVRAATPSAAAELIAPDAQQLQARLSQIAKRLQRRVQGALEQRQFRLENGYRLLQACSPARRISADRARLAHANSRLQWALQNALTLRVQRLKTQAAKLNNCDPRPKLALQQQRLILARTALEKLLRSKLSASNLAIERAASQLRALSPERTLERGYAIISNAHTGKIYARAAQISAPAALHIRLSDATVDASGTWINPQTPKPAS